MMLRSATKKRRSLATTSSELRELESEKENTAPKNRRKSLLRRASLEPSSKLARDEDFKRKRSKRISFGAADFRVYEIGKEMANHTKAVGQKPINFDDDASEMSSLRDSAGVGSEQGAGESQPASRPSLKDLVASDSPDKVVPDQEGEGDEMSADDLLASAQLPDFMANLGSNPKIDTVAEEPAGDFTEAEASSEENMELNQDKLSIMFGCEPEPEPEPEPDDEAAVEHAPPPAAVEESGFTEDMELTRFMNNNEETARVEGEEPVADTTLAEGMTEEMDFTQANGEILQLKHDSTAEQTLMTLTEENTPEEAADVSDPQPQADNVFAFISGEQQAEANDDSALNETADNGATGEMDLTQANGAILFASEQQQVAKELTEEYTMEFTGNLSTAPSDITSDLRNNVTEDMELTTAHSVLVAQEDLGNGVTEDMELTKAHGGVLVTEGVTEDMELTTAHGVLVVQGGLGDGITEDMELTKTQGGVLVTQEAVTNTSVVDESVLNETDADMELTTANGAILTFNANVNTNDSMNDSVSGMTEEMEFTKAHGSILPGAQQQEVVGVTEANPDESMELTKMHGSIVSNILDEVDKDDGDESLDFAEQTMDITQNWGHIVQHLGANVNDDDDAASADDQSHQSALESNFHNVLFGDNNDATKDLPNRQKLSQLTQDMAHIFEQILNGGNPNTEDFEKMGLNLSTTSSDADVSVNQSLDASVQGSVVDDVNNQSMSSASNQNICSNIDEPSPAVKRAISPQKTFSSTKKRKSLGTPADQKRAWNEISILADFFRVAGLQCLDESFQHLRGKSRDSSFGGCAIPDMSEWPPADMGEMLEISAIDNIEVAEFAEGCLSLVDVTAQLKPAITNMEQWFDTNQPPIFATLANSSGPELDEAQCKLQNLLKYCRQSAKCTWNYWRMNDADGLRIKLEHTLLRMRQDIQDMETLCTRGTELIVAEAERNSPQLAELVAKVDSKKVAIEGLMTQNKETQEALDQATTAMNVALEEKHGLTQRLSVLENKLQNNKANESALMDLQGQMSTLSMCTSWRPMQVQAHGPRQIALKFATGAYVLRAELNDAGAVLGIPTLVRAAPGDEFVAKLFARTTPQINKLLQSFTNSSQLTRVTASLTTLLGRLEDLTQELAALRESVTIQAVSDQTLRIFITANDSSRQAVVSCGMAPSYPFAPMPVSIKMRALTEERDAENEALKNQILKEATHTAGFGRLSQLVQRVQQLL